MKGASENISKLLKLYRSGSKKCKHSWETWNYRHNVSNCKKCGAVEVWNMIGWQRVYFSKARTGWFYKDNGQWMEAQ